VAPAESKDIAMGTGIAGCGFARPRGPLPRRSRLGTRAPFSEVLGTFMAVVETDKTDSLLFRVLKALAKS
jgi:hypothetical protein